MATPNSTPVAEIDSSREKSEKRQNSDSDAEVGQITRHADTSSSDLGKEEETGEEESIDYKTLEWWQAGVVMVAETVSLGILSLPSVMATIGLVPTIIIMIILSFFSWYAGLVMGEFKLKYNWVENFGDALEIMGRSIGCGPLFQEIFGWAQTLFMVFVMGSHILTWSICLNTLTNSAACTIVWGVVGLALFWACNIPRTLRAAGIYSFASFASIFTAVLITMIDVGIERPIGSTSIDITRQVPFTSAFLGVANIAASFSGHSAFFNVLTEMKRPQDWPKALALLQISDTVLYVVAAVVIYVFCGPDVPAPALSAANSPIVRKVIWGIAIPTIVIGGVIYGHVAARYLFVRAFKDTKHLVKKTWLGNISWLGITALVWTIAWIIAESIPVFNNLLGLMCALFASWFSFGIPGALWLWMYYGEWFNSPKKIALFTCNACLFLIGFLLCVLGLWSAGEVISKDKGSKPWSCSR
ncbi:Transmembrane amino acid transporter domain containing protein [Naviculisporaceae sp. PSN 640]